MSLKYTMKGWTLILCLLGTSCALPMYPQQTATHGIASMSLETMRRYGNLNGMGVNMMPSYSGYRYGDPFSTMWMHGLMPPHSSYPWMPHRPREQENQQQPGLQTQNLPQQPTITSVQQGHQPPIQQGQPTQQQEEQTLVQQQVAPADGQAQQIYPFIYKFMHQGPVQQVPEQQGPVQQGPMHQTPMQQVPMHQIPMQQVPMHQVPVQQVPMHPSQQQPFYPGLYYMPYTAGNRGAPARMGIVSSEEIQGGIAGVGPPAYSAIYPGFVGMGPGLGGIPQNPAFQGDFTVEDDLPAKGGQPVGQGGVIQFPNGNIPVAGVNPGTGNAEITPESNPTAQGGAPPNPNANFPNLGFEPAGQSKLPVGVTPAGIPALTQGMSDNYLPFGTDATTPLGIQREMPMTIADATVSPDVQGIPFIENEFLRPQIMQDQGYFQEP
ncbi:ameloblastin isoform X2 [Rhinatrema bivittatum]|uniref:ameloblastin isoform X2 n=1 Tax=Rhinatrema bivittatum TaxID=194408 RepID=UPI00112D70D1|nr:ameloblastin isoform X2 [Rhinatrema bivittatum]